jgi:hypothetical protein
MIAGIRKNRCVDDTLVADASSFYRDEQSFILMALQHNLVCATLIHCLTGVAA